ncbi:MAG: hypothetical protein ACYDG3_09975 [Bacillati bacterium]
MPDYEIFPSPLARRIKHMLKYYIACTFGAMCILFSPIILCIVIGNWKYLDLLLYIELYLLMPIIVIAFTTPAIALIKIIWDEAHGN